MWARIQGRARSIIDPKNLTKRAKPILEKYGLQYKIIVFKTVSYNDFGLYSDIV
jgi:hypothetical protein